MTNIDPNSSPVRSDSSPNLIQSQLTNGRAEPANVPRPTTPADHPAQPLNLEHQVVPVQENRTSGFFRYYFGPLFGLLTPAQSRVVQNVETRITSLERIFSAQSEVISRRTAIGDAVNSVGQANRDAAVEIRELDALEGEIRSLANNYARYSGIPERITELKRKKSQLVTQYQIGMLLSSYHGAVQTYAAAARDRGIADSWGAFVQARASMQDVARSLLNAITSNPDLNIDPKIQRLIRNVQGSESQAIPIIKLMRHVYPQYEKHLAKLFNDTVNISRQRIADLKQRRDNLKPLLERYRTQSLEINRLIAMRDDQGLLSGYARAFHQYRYGETVGATLARVQQNLANIAEMIDANRLSNGEEIEWLRTVAQTSTEARAAYDSLTPVISDSYKILSMTEANYAARREELSADLDRLIEDLGPRDLNGSKIAQHLSDTLEKIITFRRGADVVALPVNYNTLSNLQKVEVLVKLYFPALETKAADLILRVNRRGLTALFNETISRIAERRRNEEQANRAAVAPGGIVQPPGHVPEGVAVGDALPLVDVEQDQPIGEPPFVMPGEQEEPPIQAVEPLQVNPEAEIQNDIVVENDLPQEGLGHDQPPVEPSLEVQGGQRELPIQTVEPLQADFEEEIPTVDPLAAQLLNPVLPGPPPADFVPPPPAPPLPPPPTTTVSASRLASTSTSQTSLVAQLGQRSFSLRPTAQQTRDEVAKSDFAFFGARIQESSHLLPTGNSISEEDSEEEDSENEWTDRNFIDQARATIVEQERIRKQEAARRAAAQRAAQESGATSSSTPSPQPATPPPQPTTPSSQAATPPPKPTSSQNTPISLEDSIRARRSKQKGTRADWDDEE